MAEIIHILNTHFPTKWSNENLRERVIEFGEDVRRQSQDAHEQLVAALKAVLEHGTDSMWLEDGKRMSVFGIVAEALRAAGEASDDREG